MKKRSRPSPASQGMGEGWAAVSTLFGGFVFWGGIGWLLDHWWGTHFATPVGVILGMALGIYAVVMRYGRAPLEEHVGPEARPSAGQTDPTIRPQPASLER